MNDIMNNYTEAGNDYYEWKTILREIKKADFFFLDQVDGKYCNDRYVAFAAVKKAGGNLELISDKLKNDKKIVLEAVKNNGLSLEYAPYRFKCDREVVLTAVGQDGYAVSYADEMFNDDREVILTAVKHAYDGAESILTRKGRKFLDDKEIMIEAIRARFNVCAYASASLLKDKEFALEAIGIDPRVYQFLNVSLRADADIIHATFGDKLRFVQWDNVKDSGIDKRDNIMEKEVKPLSALAGIYKVFFNYPSDGLRYDEQSGKYYKISAKSGNWEEFTCFEHETMLLL